MIFSDGQWYVEDATTGPTSFLDGLLKWDCRSHQTTRIERLSNPIGTFNVNHH